jgi:hypothetical protein
MKLSPVAPWCTSHQAELQGVLYSVHLHLAAQAYKSNTVIDPLCTVVVPDVQGHSAFPAVEQEAKNMDVFSIEQERNGIDDRPAGYIANEMFRKSATSPFGCREHFGNRRDVLSATGDCADRSHFSFRLVDPNEAI